MCASIDDLRATARQNTELGPKMTDAESSLRRLLKDEEPPSTTYIAGDGVPHARGVRASSSARESFPMGPIAKAFRKAFFPDVDAMQWADWRWQLRARIRTQASLERIFSLSDDERSAVARHSGSLPVGITPYYASLMDRFDASDPLRRTHIPVGQEYLRVPGEADDPLGEDHDTATPGLVHRYPDRVLFLTTGTCSTYCRYCTRSRIVGEAGGEYSFSRGQWENALAYIAAHARHQLTCRFRYSSSRSQRAPARAAAALIQRFAQPVIGVLEISVRPELTDQIYSFDNKENSEDCVTYRLVTDAEALLAGKTALAAYRALGCRDAARVDMRSDADRVPQFLEVNPIAGLNPVHSDLPMIAEMAGHDFDWLIGQILTAACERLGLANGLALEAAE